MGILIPALIILALVMIFITSRKSLSKGQKTIYGFGALIVTFLACCWLIVWGWERGRDFKLMQKPETINSSETKSDSLKSNRALEIDSENLDDIPVVKNFTKIGKKSLKFRGKLTDVYRYVMLYEEQNPTIKSRFVQLGFKNITTKILIESLEKDTLYHFPIKDGSTAEKSPLKLGVTHTFYATLYTSGKEGSKIIVIDSIK